MNSSTRNSSINFLEPLWTSNRFLTEEQLWQNSIRQHVLLPFKFGSKVIFRLIDHRARLNPLSGSDLEALKNIQHYSGNTEWLKELSETTLTEGRIYSYSELKHLSEYRLSYTI